MGLFMQIVPSRPHLFLGVSPSILFSSMSVPESVDRTETNGKIISSDNAVWLMEKFWGKQNLGFTVKPTVDYLSCLDLHILFF